VLIKWQSGLKNYSGMLGELQEDVIERAKELEMNELVTPNRA